MMNKRQCENWGLMGVYAVMTPLVCLLQVFFEHNFQQRQPGKGGTELPKAAAKYNQFEFEPAD
jgi:hypothetical protein